MPFVPLQTDSECSFLMLWAGAMQAPFAVSLLLPAHHEAVRALGLLHLTLHFPYGCGLYPVRSSVTLVVSVT
jgi:hypothetical protein